jgi:hypothetical protein
VDQANNGKTVVLRIAAIRQLTNRQRPEAISAVLKEWKRLPEHDPNGAFEGFDALVDFLCASGDSRAMQALIADWDRREVNERVKIVHKVGEWLAPRACYVLLSEYSCTSDRFCAIRCGWHAESPANQETIIPVMSATKSGSFAARIWN